MTRAPARELADASRLDLTTYVRPGDGVFWSQACSEPVGLVDRLVEQGVELGALAVYCGHTFRESLLAPTTEAFTVTSHGALGALGRVAEHRPVHIIPSHYSELPTLFASRRIRGDIALLQVAPPDSSGGCSYGMDAGYVADAVRHARVVIAEINQQMPATGGDGIHVDDLDVIVHSDRPVLEAPPARVSPADELIAGHVASLVEDGDTIQIGVGGLPAAVMRRLTHLRDLGFHSGLISDPVIDLVEAGVITGARKRTDRGRIVAGSALGSQRLTSFLATSPDVDIRAVSHTHRPDVLLAVGRLIAINSAIEVDLTGQVNSETVGGRWVGAVGGQVDFLRAARATGGVGIVALPSIVAKTGATRIVAALSGPVTTARSDVDTVVTEHGVARLTGLDLARRAAALIAIADPQHREELERHVHSWSAA